MERGRGYSMGVAVAPPAPDRDRVRADVADREVVLERLVEDRRLGGDELEEQPRRRTRVVVGQLDERAPQPRVLALRGAGEVGARQAPGS